MFWAQVLDVFRYADRDLLALHPELTRAKVFVHLASHIEVSPPPPSFPSTTTAITKHPHTMNKGILRFLSVPDTKRRIETCAKLLTPVTVDVVLCFWCLLLFFGVAEDVWMLEVYFGC